eukprot:TRINITY_DN5589_c0_g1_i3.p1 TRINITY_DN5589_c0_g1~~TRINITY_DN5589_c0_g1_i3.p1  ORF type:complete len:379 (+),score=60.24 TRINITY_DN5589_c0_g1_i3:455-1591(+)
MEGATEGCSPEHTAKHEHLAAVCVVTVSPIGIPTTAQPLVSSASRSSSSSPISPFPAPPSQPFTVHKPKSKPTLLARAKRHLSVVCLMLEIVALVCLGVLLTLGSSTCCLDMRCTPDSWNGVQVGPDGFCEGVEKWKWWSLWLNNATECADLANDTRQCAISLYNASSNFCSQTGSVSLTGVSAGLPTAGAFALASSMFLLVVKSFVSLVAFALSCPWLVCRSCCRPVVYFANAVVYIIVAFLHLTLFALNFAIGLYIGLVRNGIVITECFLSYWGNTEIRNECLQLEESCSLGFLTILQGDSRVSAAASYVVLVTSSLQFIRAGVIFIIAMRALCCCSDSAEDRQALALHLFPEAEARQREEEEEGEPESLLLPLLN